jgi:hypothetical protein
MDKPKIKSKGKDISIKDFIYGMILATILLLLWFYGFGGEASQIYGLKHTRIWIEKNKDKWKELQKQNPNLMNVRFGAFTAYQGCLMVLIEGKLTDKDKVKLYEFILNYDIPRRIKIFDVYKQNMKHQPSESPDQKTAPQISGRCS